MLDEEEQENIIVENILMAQDAAVATVNVVQQMDVIVAIVWNLMWRHFLEATWLTERELHQNVVEKQVCFTVVETFCKASEDVTAIVGRTMVQTAGPVGLCSLRKAQDTIISIDDFEIKDATML